MSGLAASWRVAAAALVFALILSSCSAGGLVEELTWLSVETESAFGAVDHGSGIGPYLDGKKHGEWTYFHPGGGIAIECVYVDDVMAGPIVVWATNGTVLVSFRMNNGEPAGEWVLGERVFTDRGGGSPDSDRTSQRFEFFLLDDSGVVSVVSPDLRPLGEAGPVRSGLPRSVAQLDSVEAAAFRRVAFRGDPSINRLMQQRRCVEPGMMAVGFPPDWPDDVRLEFLDSGSGFRLIAPSFYEEPLCVRVREGQGVLVRIQRNKLLAILAAE